MEKEIMVALITGCFSLAGVMISNLIAGRKQAQTLKTGLALTELKLQELTREVREHNGFARRMPVVEEQILDLQRRMERLERSLHD